MEHDRVTEDAIDPPAPGLRVLASGSTGNCSMLRWTDQRGAQLVWLIDAGLSPRRTNKLLQDNGTSLDAISGVILTHFDSDHWHTGWTRRWDKLVPPAARVLVHFGHSRRVGGLGRAAASVQVIENDTRLEGGVTLRSVLAAHDHAGSMALRFDFDAGGSLGFATDLGHVDSELVERMRAVDVLAIEPNYCPVLQREPGRPEFLVSRITGGCGHLSNEQAYETAKRVRPREHVVLLHLSQECNRPDRALRLHAREPYACIVSSAREPTPWIRIGGRRRAFREIQPSLFDALAVPAPRTRGAVSREIRSCCAPSNA